jgi:hypothetical protein
VRGRMLLGLCAWLRDEALEVGRTEHLQVEYGTPGFFLSSRDAWGLSSSYLLLSCHAMHPKITKVCAAPDLESSIYINFHILFAVRNRCFTLECDFFVQFVNYVLSFLFLWHRHSSRGY